MIARPRPLSTVKRPRVERRGPGRPRKLTRIEDFEQNWYDAVMSDQESFLRVWECYEVAIVSYYSEKTRNIPVWPTKFQASYTAERRFEIREYAFGNPECSYQQIADAFRIPKTSVFNIIKRQPSGEPVKGRGNKKGAGRPLS